MGGVLPLLVRMEACPGSEVGSLFSLPGTLDSALLALRLKNVSLQLESPSFSVTGLLYFLARSSQCLIIFLRVEI